MSKKLSVLVVDDEEHIRNILEYNLKSDGFKVYLAEGGLAGIDLARKKNPDLILLDWILPEMDGLEILSELKQDQRTKNIPVIMLTAKRMMFDVGQALYAGADEFITKPFDPAELVQTVRRKLEERVKGLKDTFLPPTLDQKGE